MAFHKTLALASLLQKAYLGSHRDHPPSHYYENSTSKNKNTAEIAQGVVKSQERYRDVLTAHDIF